MCVWFHNTNLNESTESRTRFLMEQIYKWGRTWTSTKPLLELIHCHVAPVSISSLLVNFSLKERLLFEKEINFNSKCFRKTLLDACDSNKHGLHFSCQTVSLLDVILSIHFFCCLSTTGSWGWNLNSSLSSDLGAFFQIVQIGTKPLPKQSGDITPPEIFPLMGNV